jgi:hypothetical protein
MHMRNVFPACPTATVYTHLLQITDVRQRCNKKTFKELISFCEDLCVGMQRRRGQTRNPNE